MQPQILKEEKNYLVINKPAGLVVHSDGRTKEKTLCDFLIENYPEIKNVGEPLKLSDGTEINKPGIVHRLDRETSGIMIVARKQLTFEYFKELFQKHQIEKTYHTFVYGNIKNDLFEIDEPIARSKKDFRQWMSGKNIRGKLRPALTKIKVLKRSNQKNKTFVEAKPKTGRTHQIRVHLKSINNPIVADKIYAPNRPKLLGLDRLALHSYKIKFTDPDQKKVEFTADYPDDFKEAISNFS